MKVAVFLFLILGTSLAGKAQPVAPPAEKVMAAAFRQAKKEDKHVFILFHASWCGWCHKMDASMRDSTVSKFFTDNYVIVHLTVEEVANKKNLENEGAFAFKAKYHGAQAGLPFWLIMDKKKNLIADSQIRPEGTPITAAGTNIGCPADNAGVQYFIDVLRKTSTLDEASLKMIGTVFSRNILR